MGGDDQHAAIDTFGLEDRTFPPPEGFGGLIADRSLFDEAAADHEGFWARQARELLTWQREELEHIAPSSPIDDLALGLQQLADWDGSPADFTPLFAGLTLAWAFGDEAARVALYQESLFRPSPELDAPVALETYPLDAPCLRRLVEQRFSVASTTEHDRGGVLPALESSARLVRSLRRVCAASAKA